MPCNGPESPKSASPQKRNRSETRISRIRTKVLRAKARFGVRRLDAAFLLLPAPLPPGQRRSYQSPALSSMSVDDEIRDNSCNWCRATARFWRNVVLIALAHIALIAGLIRWSVAARASTNAESIVWLGEDLAAGQPENEEAPSAQREAHPIEPKPLKDEQAEEEKPLVTAAQSEIELPSPTPKPTSTPKPSSIPTPKPKATPKVIPKPARNATHNVAGGPTPKKILLAKATPASLREAAAGRASP